MPKIIHGTGADDILFGTDDSEKILAGGGNDTVFASGGHDTVQGGDGNDEIDGGAGDDDIQGGNGDDSIAGGRGADSLKGGDGFDTAVYESFPTGVGRGKGNAWLITASGATDELKQFEQVRVDAGDSSYVFALDGSNNAPLAFDDTAATDEDTPLAIAASALLANDYDFEGDPLAVTGVGNAQHGAVAIDDGTITFTPASNYFGAASFDYTISDGHGGSATANVAITVSPNVDLDVFVCNYGGPNLILSNDGSGNFTADAAPGATYHAIGVAVGDLNGDGDLDVIATNEQPYNDRMYTNTGSGQFQVTEVGTPGYGWDVALGDLDGDLDLDAYIANHGYNEILFNQGDADADGVVAFTTTKDWPSGSHYTHGVELGDLDGDGALDVVLANGNAPNQILYNNGSGIFLAVNNTPEPIGNSYDTAIGDFDGDQDLDVFVANSGSANWILTNLGNRTFSFAQAPGITNAVSQDVAAGDFDADGDLDVFIANAGHDEILLNDGNGGFSARITESFNTNSHAVALGDLDSDGDLDVFVANRGDPNKILFNDGSGTFVAMSAGYGNDSVGVAIGDLDGDGSILLS